MAPPWDRVITPWSARRARSRRIVAGDTPSNSARSSTPTTPLSSMTAMIDRRRLSRIRGRRFRAPWPTVNGCSGPGARTSSSLSWLPPRWSGGTIGSGLPAIGGRFFSRTLTARPRKWLSLFDAARDDAFHDPPIQQEYENRRDSDCNYRGGVVELV